MGNKKDAKLSLKAIGPKLLGPRRTEYWRSLDQLAQTDDFKKWVEDEFPDRDSLLQIDRRQFVKLMGASMLMASLAGCRSLPTDKIVPYVKTPEGQNPGQNQFYATSVVIGGYGMPALVESRQGRPGKIEGHPEHAATLGSSDHLMQAALYDFYDPDRLQSVEHNGLVSTWEDFGRAIRPVLKATKGDRIRVLTSNVTSPTLTRLMGEFMKKHQGVKWHTYEPFGETNANLGAKLAFGQAVQPVFWFDRADVVVSLGSDFLYSGPGHVRYSRDFAKRRAVDDKNPNLNRFFALYSEATITSAAADNGLAVKPSKLEQCARALLGAIDGQAVTGLDPEATKFVQAAAHDLAGSGGRCIVVAGDTQPPVVHAIANAINAKLGAVGLTVEYIDRVSAGDENHVESLKELTDAMNAGAVDILFVLDANPVFTAPSDIRFAEALKHVKHSVCHSTHRNETSTACTWRLPEAHSLEAWGDARAYDGSTVIQQPMIQPLYSGRSSIELLSFLEDTKLGGRDMIVETLLSGIGGAQGDERIDQIIHDGMVANRSAARPVTLNPNILNEPASVKPSQLELVVGPDPTVGDGRWGNNAWLQELPKPMISTTWDNVVAVSPKTAKDLGLPSVEDDPFAKTDQQQGSWVNVKVGGLEVKGMVCVVPGMADETIVVHAGYGRTAGGTIATGQSWSLPEQAHPLKQQGDQVGFNAYPLLVSAGAIGAAVEVTKAGGVGKLASVQLHHSMEGRDIVRSGTVEEFKTNPSLAEHHGHHEDITLFDQTTKDGEGQYLWAMTIDLSLCTGCNACTIACQSENNIPSVGKEQVLRGREMHWIRIDRYYAGSAVSPTDTVFMPVPCMQCEKAPCEPVCPVAATVHSKEGLNQMVYNRCVGTRYCSNNCPYKVRRFNFLNYLDKVDKPSLTLLNNPDVTVRGRGVMEKCTYCVQRINHARISAKKDGRGIRDGEIVTACQQACPSGAILFGDKSDVESAVAKAKKSPRNYTLLEEVNTTPRTTYLGRVRNPHPDLVPAAAASEKGEAH